jgi:hypothetical protein
MTWGSGGPVVHGAYPVLPAAKPLQSRNAELRVCRNVRSGKPDERLDVESCSLSKPIRLVNLVFPLLSEAAMTISRHKYWKWTTLVPMLVVLGVFFVTIFDPFEWESITKKWSARIVYKIYGALYPKNYRDKITVVFLDRKTLDARSESWPPSHLVHSDVVSAILGYHPVALLVDIFFTEERKDDHFAATANVVKKTQTT